MLIVRLEENRNQWLISFSLRKFKSNGKIMILKPPAILDTEISGYLLQNLSKFTKSIKKNFYHIKLNNLSLNL